MAAPLPSRRVLVFSIFGDSWLPYEVLRHDPGGYLVCRDANGVVFEGRVDPEHVRFPADS